MVFPGGKDGLEPRVVWHLLSGRVSQAPARTMRGITVPPSLGEGLEDPISKRTTNTQAVRPLYPEHAWSRLISEETQGRSQWRHASEPKGGTTQTPVSRSTDRHNAAEPCNGVS